MIPKRGEFQYQALVRRRGYEQQTKTFTTYKEAAAWGLTTESEMVRGVFISRVEAERTTLSEVIERYILEVCPKHKGRDSEILRLRSLARTPLGCRFIATLTVSTLHKWGWRSQQLKQVWLFLGRRPNQQSIHHAYALRLHRSHEGEPRTIPWV